MGAQLFPLNDLNGLLCIRRFGGPPLQIAALGNQLKESWEAEVKHGLLRTTVRNVPETGHA